MVDENKTTIPNDLEDKSIPFHVSLLKGAVSIEGDFTDQTCDSTGMEVNSVPNMVRLTGQAFPTGPSAATITIKNGKLTPSRPSSTYYWDFRVKGSSAPTQGVELAAANDLTLSLADGGALKIKAKRGDLVFSDPPNAAATMGCLEIMDMVSTGPYSAAEEDVDFLFHYSYVQGGINEKTNKIPLLVKTRPKREGKKVDCFAVRWF